MEARNDAKVHARADPASAHHRLPPALRDDARPRRRPGLRTSSRPHQPSQDDSGAGEFREHHGRRSLLVRYQFRRPGNAEVLPRRPFQQGRRCRGRRDRHVHHADRAQQWTRPVRRVRAVRARCRRQRLRRPQRRRWRVPLPVRDRRTEPRAHGRPQDQPADDGQRGLHESGRENTRRRARVRSEGWAAPGDQQRFRPAVRHLDQGQQGERGSHRRDEHRLRRGPWG